MKHIAEAISLRSRALGIEETINFSKYDTQVILEAEEKKIREVLNLLEKARRICALLDYRNETVSNLLVKLEADQRRIKDLLVGINEAILKSFYVQKSKNIGYGARPRKDIDMDAALADDGDGDDEIEMMLEEKLKELLETIPYMEKSSQKKLLSKLKQM